MIAYSIFQQNIDVYIMTILIPIKQMDGQQCNSRKGRTIIMVILRPIDQMNGHWSNFKEKNDYNSHFDTK